MELEEKFEADTLSEDQVNATIAELQGDTPLSQLNHGDAHAISPIRSESNPRETDQQHCPC